MQSPRRFRALEATLFVAVVAVGVFVVARTRTIARNRDRFGPPPLDVTPASTSTSTHSKAAS